MVKLTACFGQCDGPRVAVEQLRAKFGFQGRDLLADGRLANAALFGYGRKISCVCYADEQLHGAKSIHRGPPCRVKATWQHFTGSLFGCVIPF
jgi:hypothetical protein